MVSFVYKFVLSIVSRKYWIVEHNCNESVILVVKKINIHSSLELEPKMHYNYVYYTKLVMIIVVVVITMFLEYILDDTICMNYQTTDLVLNYLIALLCPCKAITITLGMVSRVHRLDNDRVATNEFLLGTVQCR